MILIRTSKDTEYNTFAVFEKNKNQEEGNKPILHSTGDTERSLLLTFSVIVVSNCRNFFSERRFSIREESNEIRRDRLGSKATSEIRADRIRLREQMKDEKMKNPTHVHWQDLHLKAKRRSDEGQPEERGGMSYWFPFSNETRFRSSLKRETSGILESVLGKPLLIAFSS